MRGEESRGDKSFRRADPAAPEAQTPQKQQVEARPPQQKASLVKPRGVHGLVEEEAAPKSPSDLLARLRSFYARDWHRIASLDGRAGRKRPIEVLESLWGNFSAVVLDKGLQVAEARAWAYLLTDAQKVWGAYERDPQAPKATAPDQQTALKEWEVARGRVRMAKIQELGKLEGIEVPGFSSSIGSAWMEWASSETGKRIRGAAHSAVDEAFEASNPKPRRGAA